MHCFIAEVYEFHNQNLRRSRTYKLRNEETWKLEGTNKKKKTIHSKMENAAKARPETIYTQRIRREKARGENTDGDN